MRKHIIILFTLLIVSFSFCSCVEMAIIGICWAKSFPYHENYFFCVDSALVATDTLSVEFVGGRIPRKINKKSISYYDTSAYIFTAKDTIQGTIISKSLAGKHKEYHFFDDAICTDTIRLYKNDTLIVTWDKSNLNTYHNPYNHDQWIKDYQWGCSERGTDNFYFSIKPEDIEKWKNEK